MQTYGLATPDQYPQSLQWAALWDMSRNDMRWQDSSGTTIATVNNPVGLVRDQSGNGRDISNATAANRPTLIAWDDRIAAAYIADSTDILNGNDACKSITNAAPGITFCAGIEVIPSFGSAAVVWRSSTNAGGSMFLVYVDSAGVLTLQTRRVSADSVHTFAALAALTAGERYAILCSANYSTGAVRVAYATGKNALTIRAGTASWGTGATSEALNGSAAALGAAPGGGTPFTQGAIAWAGLLMRQMTTGEESQWANYIQNYLDI